MKEFFNFFDIYTVFNKICEHFSLDQDEVYNYLILHEEEVGVESFIKHFNISLRKSISNIYIRCRHGLNSIDNLSSIKKYGLLNLEEVLKNNTSLNKYLIKNGILIKVKNRQIIIDGKRYKISMKEPTFSILFVKLYIDRGQTEGFASGTFDDIYDYGTINGGPEILRTIDEICLKLECNKKLFYKWSTSGKNQFFIIEFDTLITNLWHSGRDTNTYYNKKLIDLFIASFFEEHRYIQLKEQTKIKPKDIVNYYWYSEEKFIKYN